MAVAPRSEAAQAAGAARRMVAILPGPADAARAAEERGGRFRRFPAQEPHELLRTDRQRVRAPPQCARRDRTGRRARRERFPLVAGEPARLAAETRVARGHGAERRVHVRRPAPHPDRGERPALTADHGRAPERGDRRDRSGDGRAVRRAQSTARRRRRLRVRVGAVRRHRVPLPDDGALLRAAAAVGAGLVGVHRQERPGRAARPRHAAARRVRPHAGLGRGSRARVLRRPRHSGPCKPRRVEPHGGVEVLRVPAEVDQGAQVSEADRRGDRAHGR